MRLLFYIQSSSYYGAWIADYSFGWRPSFWWR